MTTRLDRWGRSLVDLVNTGDDLRRRGVQLKVLEQGIDTTTPEGPMMFGMLAVIAEFQRELIIANTRDGLATAWARGRRGGRRAKLTAKRSLARRLCDEVGTDGKRAHTVADIAKMFGGVSRATVYRAP